VLPAYQSIHHYTCAIAGAAAGVASCMHLQLVDDSDPTLPPASHHDTDWMVSAWIVCHSPRTGASR
jgi:hypothetical protein